MSACAALANQSTQTEALVDVPADGRYSFRNLPFGFYRLLVSHSGFIAYSELIEIRSEIPRPTLSLSESFPSKPC